MRGVRLEHEADCLTSVPIIFGSESHRRELLILPMGVQPESAGLEGP